MNIYHNWFSDRWSLVFNHWFVRTLLMAVAIVTVIGIVPCFASGPHLATLVMKNSSRVQGRVRYLASSKVYSISDGKFTKEFPAADVMMVVLKSAPAQLDSAVKSVKNGQYASAVVPLRKIITDYEMFGSDLVAAQYLAKAYLNLNKAPEAVRICKDILSSNPSAIDDLQFAGIYMDALLQDKKFATLNRLLDDMIQKGTHEVRAVALVKRGDVYMEKGETEKALRDGYLRTIHMFSDVKEIQPEALYKALKAHQAINEHPYAEKCRKGLLAGYPSSEYAKKIK